jgi:hypothetical protein
MQQGDSVPELLNRQHEHLQRALSSIPGPRATVDAPSDHAALRARMEAGFRRRRKDFVKEMFDKHKSPGESPGICKANLTSALEELGIFVSAREADEMFHTHDLDRDGWTNFSEFLSMASRAGRVEQWATNLPFPQLLADCMPPFKNEADALRAISDLSSTEIKMIAACFSEGLVRLLGEEIDKLKRAHQEMDRNAEAASKSEAGAKFTLSKMSCGDIDDFRKGLSGRIGDPFLDFERAMEAEHCHSQDSMTSFTTRNYGIQTCARNEWRIVVHSDTNNANMKDKRRIPIIEEALQLPMAKAAKLLRVEVIAVVLYTGPMV